ncbi:hypothetical protein [Herbidospora cretacea]|uniref:hypothetical protein n=1 Tax=Herbidospora cretacea TaxID=28444 RepID=UPI0007747B76|nr:hypothetical protein [Herbidospora cretacea]
MKLRVTAALVAAVVTAAPAWAAGDPVGPVTPDDRASLVVEEGGTSGGVLDGTQEEPAQGSPVGAKPEAPGKPAKRSPKRLANAGLAITAPTSRALGSTTIGGQLSAQLGAVTVTDDRGLLVQLSYTATVSSTNFTTTVGGNTSTIAKSHVSYWSGPATSSSGVGVFTPGQLTAATAAALTGTTTAFAVTLAAGNTSVAWNPTVIVRIPSSAVAGSYSGTITHSVA